MDIDVTSVCGADIISRESGRKIRELLLANWSEPELQLLFRGRKVASVSFFDEAIGLLIKKGGKSVEEMRTKLKFPDLTPSDRKLLGTVVKARIEEGSSSIR